METNILQSFDDSKTNNPIDQINKHNSRSENYRLINSRQVENKLFSKGFELVGRSSANVRKESNRGFQKHLSIYTHKDFILDNDNRLQLLVTNNHLGNNALSFNLGVFRAICANGLVAGNDYFQERVTHVGNVNKKIDDSIEILMTNYPALVEKIKHMSETFDFDKDKLRKQAAELRLNDYSKQVEQKQIKAISCNLKSVDRIRRDGDKGIDLYTTFNRIQETIIRGGLDYLVLDNDLNIIPKKTRAIKSINKTIELNKQLWQLVA